MFLLWVKIMLGFDGRQLIERLREQTTSTKTPVLAKILRAPTSVIIYRNSHISAEFELELTLSRWLWKRGEKGGASLQKQARVRALCGVMQ